MRNSALKKAFHQINIYCILTILVPNMVFFARHRRLLVVALLALHIMEVAPFTDLDDAILMIVAIRTLRVDREPTPRA